MTREDRLMITTSIFRANQTGGDERIAFTQALAVEKYVQKKLLQESVDKQKKKK